MAQRHAASTSRPRSVGLGVAPPRASIRAILALAAAVLGVCAVLAHADNVEGEPRQSDTNVQRAAQTPPPARVVLPAPWEQATPVPTTVTPAAPADRK
jgi:hypothetical protein